MAGVLARTAACAVVGERVDDDGGISLEVGRRRHIGRRDTEHPRQTKQRQLEIAARRHQAGAIESDADSLEDIVTEMFTARTSERQGRLIDSDEKASMEKKKKEGYF